MDDKDLNEKPVVSRLKRVITGAVGGFVLLLLCFRALYGHHLFSAFTFLAAVCFSYALFKTPEVLLVTLREVNANPFEKIFKDPFFKLGLVLMLVLFLIKMFYGN